MNSVAWSGATHALREAEASAAWKSELIQFLVLHIFSEAAI
jgi:hypothetical protein